ncbi:MULTISPECIES: helix-turn-helix domain-containing protein [unclassified Mesorhizobium]|uniref:helix-turn-helix domain-containing protein n=1 Tax=unclassified Mesorhizobium TaxID=325217 RepID=UPI000A05528C|nr:MULTISPECIES: helix-turn-helix domain-containing protein [unclassified Mesorhizobium]
MNHNPASDETPGKPIFKTVSYYSQVRLKKARQLLETTDMSVIEVAIACGYVSSSHFSKAFKDHFGRLPSHVRPWACSVVS